MKTVIFYYSRHKGNTLKVLEAMAEGRDDVELVDVTARAAVQPDAYDRIGFASGIYAGRFHETVSDFARQYLPEGRDVFLVCTSASGKGGPGGPMKKVLKQKHANVLGMFRCQGLTTFGPFGLMHGFPKDQPDAAALERAKAFFAAL